MDFVDLDVAERCRLAGPSFLSPPCTRMLLPRLTRGLFFLSPPCVASGASAGEGPGVGFVNAIYSALTCSLRSAIFRTAPTRERLFSSPLPACGEGSGVGFPLPA